jgi:hypothetical protein
MKVGKEGNKGVPISQNFKTILSNNLIQPTSTIKMSTHNRQSINFFSCSQAMRKFSIARTTTNQATEI